MSSTRNPSSDARRLPVWTRAALSVLVIVHVTAVFTGPWAVFAPRVPAGQDRPDELLLAGDFAGVLRPYLDATFLGNGYRFFAPEPGPSHLIRYEVVLSDGSKVEGYFPNRQEHQPRLLYHRYFMLSEFANTLENPATPAEIRAAVARSYAQHLAHKFGAREVKLYLQRHYIPRMKEVRDGMSLTEPVLYEKKLLISYQGDAS